MHSIIIIVSLLDFAAQDQCKELMVSHISEVQDSWDNFMDTLANKLVDRVLKVLPLHRSDLNDILLGKAGSLPLSAASQPPGLLTPLPP